MPRKTQFFWAPWLGYMAIMCLLLLAGPVLKTVAKAQSASAPTAAYIDVTKVVPAIPPSAGKVPVAALPAAQGAKRAAEAPTPVLAASGAPAATPAFSVSTLLDWLLKLAGIALATLIPLLLQRWLGGKISADTLAAYSKLAVDAVGHAEELAHQAVKANGPKLDSSAKANAAVAYVLQAADALKLRPMAESAVKQMIDAKLGQGRTSAQ